MYKRQERDIITCDENGFAETKDLPYGIYTVHQVKGWDGRELLPDFDVYIAKNRQTYRYLANNANFESYIKIVKVDAETGKVIPLAGAGFRLYRPDGSLITQTFTYPEVTTIDTFYTNSDGYLITPEKLEYVMELKNVFRGRIKEYADRYPEATYYAGQRPWGVKCDIAMPCATQNELNGDEAAALVKNGCICVAEGANMPSTPEAIKVFQEHKLLYAPGKAANAGGVATSGLEMSQNSMRLHWSPEEVDAKLRAIMQNIHEVCVKYGTEPDGYVNYVKGANIGGFMKVANAMLAQGCC